MNLMVDGLVDQISTFNFNNLLKRPYARDKRNISNAI